MMKTGSLFERKLQERYFHECQLIREAAHQLHASVNQTYGNGLPYSVHLDMVVDGVLRYADEVCFSEDDILPLYFGAYFHDSIEDARLTYNDVVRTALQFMNATQAHLAAELVYALTNEKGRSRAERANEKYYQGIRSTPYAPFVKLADRLANASFSNNRDVSGDNENHRMRMVYRSELPHFLSLIHVDETDDSRFLLPQKMIDELYACFE